MFIAVYFTNIFENVYRIKYRGQILYNVLMKKHSQMEIHNFICETLHPEHAIAKLYKYTKHMNPALKEELTKEYNKYAIAHEIYSR
jgi:hypothetical protein